MEEMRRKDREVTELETVKEIIRQCDVLRLGLADGDYPYIVPMNFGWEEKEGRLYFYLHGAAEGRKAELLPGFEAFCKQKGYTFRIPVEEVFDYCVLEFGFSYWQWGQEMSVLPAADAPAACNALNFDK